MIAVISLVIGSAGSAIAGPLDGNFVVMHLLYRKIDQK
jgi:hypothetical protein